jgi:hypothetical protein
MPLAVPSVYVCCMYIILRGGRKGSMGGCGYCGASRSIIQASSGGGGTKGPLRQKWSAPLLTASSVPPLLLASWQTGDELAHRDLGVGALQVLDSAGEGQGPLLGSEEDEASTWQATPLESLYQMSMTAATALAGRHDGQRLVTSNSRRRRAAQAQSPLLQAETWTGGSGKSKP